MWLVWKEKQKVDKRREEKGIVKRKMVRYLLNHGIPIHSPEGPVIVVLAVRATLLT
jgi:hypothetical protein